MGFVRLVVFGFLALSVVYVCIAIYSRSVRREKLEKRWAAEHPDGGDSAARDTYIADGMRAYHASFRPKLIALVYVVPTVVVGAILYFTN
jgi:hypothetical protein